MEIIKHSASLPWCYYDKYSQRILIRITTGICVNTIIIIYGDPFDFVKNSNGEHCWCSNEAVLNKKYITEDSVLWQVELEPPKWRRMKYIFRIEIQEQNELKSYYFSENGLVQFSKNEINEPYDYFFLPFIHGIDSPCVPTWAANTIWYQIFPERFISGDNSISPPDCCDWENGQPTFNNFFGGDLIGIRNKLDYLKNLGITGLYLTPVFTSPSNHKYDTSDYMNVDPHFGGKKALKALVEEAHKRGIRIMLDAVFNHVGAKHSFWQDVLINQEDSPYRNFFHIHNFPVSERYLDHKSMNFDTFSFQVRMPKWNTENKAVRDYLIGAACYWIKECDIDAWRLDVANEVSVDFWHAFASAVRQIKDNFYIVGEIWHDATPWINANCFDSVMNYPLGFAIRDYFLKERISISEFNHRLFHSISRYSKMHTEGAFNLLDSHDTPRILTMANGNKQAVRNALTILFMLPGSPSIYYGTEIGMEGGQDPDCRRPMIWNEEKQDKDLYKYIQFIIDFRKQNINFINECSIEFYITEEGNGKWIFRYEDKYIILEYINKIIEMDTNLIKIETNGI
jgi:cyclomaltodextrinase / maltogenic alpha-amylase / neopullulanase